MSSWALWIVIALAVAGSAWAVARRRKSRLSGPIAPLNEAMLIGRVRLAIQPAFPRWVLFANGTYVIVEDEDTDPSDHALAQMREFGPVHGGSPAGDFSVIKLKTTEGWSVSGHGYGMYTYVHPSELNSWRPSDVQIGLHGRRKRAADAEELRIVRVECG